MAHRDDREALRAKNVALERELADAREALERARAPVDARPRPSRLAPIAARGRKLLGALITHLSPRPSLASWGTARALAFAALVALLVAGTAVVVISLFTYMDGPGPDEGPIEVAFWAAVAWAFLGPGTVAWAAARLLRAPGSAGTAGAVAGVIALGVVVAPGFFPGLQDAPRFLVGGTASGTLEQVRAQPGAAWGRIEPAYVLGAIGTGVYTSTDSQGRTSTSSVSCSPIVPAVPWDGPVTFFLCGDRDDLSTVGRGPGFVAGRITRATGMEYDAVQDLSRSGILVDVAPRAVTATVGGAEATFALGVIGLLLVIGVGSLGGAFYALRAATTKAD